MESGSDGDRKPYSAIDSRQHHLFVIDAILDIVWQASYNSTSSCQGVGRDDYSLTDYPPDY